MKLDMKKSDSWCVAEEGHRSIKAIREDIYQGKNVSDGFTLLQTDIAPIEQTRFKVYRDGGDVVIAIAPDSRIDHFDHDDDVEIFFDPYHDHVGFYQFCFAPAGNVVEFSHLPYPEAQSSAFPRVSLKSYSWESEASQNVVGVDETSCWLVARFAADGIFRNDNCCGFNIARFSGTMSEPDTWNSLSGCGFPDATGLGHLYWEAAPNVVNVTAGHLKGDRLVLAGEATVDSVTFELFDPYGESKPVPVTPKHGAWQVDIPLGTLIHGRYRLYPKSTDGASLEPEFFYFDYVSLDEPQRHDLCMTYDIPDNLRNNVYTPERLETQIDQLMEDGISKLYWIDYPPYEEWLAFWEWASIGKFCKESYQYGDLLNIAAEISKRKGLEFWGIFKPFDLGFSGNWGTNSGGNISKRKAEQIGVIKDINNRYEVALPEIVTNQQWTMGTNPEWVRDIVFPVTRIRFYSEEPITALTAADITLWVSEDNATFTRYTGPCTLKQGTMARPHYRWTPAGKVREQGTKKNWYLDLSGLHLGSLFVSLEIKKDASLLNQTFMLVEATDSHGDEAPVMLGGGSREKGLSFDAPWSWNNYTEQVVNRAKWSLQNLGIIFAVRKKQSTIFDPSYAQARSLWLRQAERTLKSDAVGVDIRTLCHHKTCNSWLMYAFAGTVRDTFRERFGRDIAMTNEDYTQVRIIRGEYYTDFMRDVRRLANQYGKKVAAHLEPGIEVPIEMNIRMQMQVDWKRWIAEGLIDEITLKYWTPQNKFIQEEVLPLARKANIPVYQGERNFVLNGPRAFEIAEWVAKNTYRAGLAGFNFYEVHSYYYLNPAGESWTVGNASQAIRHAADVMWQYCGQ